MQTTRILAMIISALLISGPAQANFVTDILFPGYEDRNRQERTREFRRGFHEQRKAAHKRMRNNRKLGLKRLKERRKDYHQGMSKDWYEAFKENSRSASEKIDMPDDLMHEDGKSKHTKMQSWKDRTQSLKNRLKQDAFMD